MESHGLCGVEKESYREPGKGTRLQGVQLCLARGAQHTPDKGADLRRECDVTTCLAFQAQIADMRTPLQH